LSTNSIFPDIICLADFFANTTLNNHGIQPFN